MSENWLEYVNNKILLLDDENYLNEYVYIDTHHVNSAIQQIKDRCSKMNELLASFDLPFIDDSYFILDNLDKLFDLSNREIAYEIQSTYIAFTKV